MATPMILDCDPGHDDALAILLAASHPAIDLLAITTVAGNQTMEKCTINARRICSAAGITDVPIAKGAAEPLLGTLHIGEYVHGVSGLDGPEWGEPTVGVSSESAVELIVRLLREHPEPITLVPVGPLTNIALVLKSHPELKPKIREIVLMGGSTERGNDTPYAEFNIKVDPEAADIVFRSGVQVTMVGLNVTHQALAVPEVLERLSGLGTRMGDLCVELLTFFSASYLRTWGFTSPPLHDAVAVARVIDPTLVECIPVPVVIETMGRFTSGATCVDLHHLTGEPDNALVAMKLDAPRFWDLMIEAVSTYE
ncbi:MAG: pyrimidine-specific ribonucleoside hydrolase RihA [Actinobacteria bacterium HGW-Actinobacteria-6]|nr:MAG: pyrimidine-specific ribonucleoside hydrolase RihA [Actinobacteria bacterium HGW-Actinobacteria-6]